MEVVDFFSFEVYVFEEIDFDGPVGSRGVYVHLRSLRYDYSAVLLNN